jgi:hypothetical protein
VHGIGNITITVSTTSGESTTLSSSALSPVSVHGDPPPVALPPTGVPGQTITIINNIPNGGQQSWTNTWVSASTGWDLTSQGSCSKPGCSIVITNPG